MKKVLLLIILVLIGLAAVPFGVGILIQKEYQAFVANLAHSPGLSVKQIDYQKSYLRSQAKTQIIWSHPSDPRRKTRFLLEHKIWHGPIILEPGSEVHFYLAKIESQLQSDLKLFNQLHLKTIIPYQGLYTTRVQGEGFKHLFSETTRLNWKGLEGQFDHTVDFKNIIGEMSFPYLRYEEGDNFIEISQIGLTGKREKNAAHIWIGDAHFKLGSLILRQDNKVLIDLSSVEVDDKTREAHGMLSEEMKWRFRKAAVGLELYGPGSGYFKFYNIDIKSLRRFQDLIKQVHEGEILHSDLIAKGKQILFYMLLRNPGVAIEDLNLEIPEGALKISGEVSIGGPILENIEDTVAILKTVKAKLFSEIPKKIVYQILKNYQRQEMQKEILNYSLAHQAKPTEIPKQMTFEEMQAMLDSKTQKQIAYFLEQGLLVDLGENYQIQALFREGELLVNGQPVNLRLTD